MKRCVILLLSVLFLASCAKASIQKCYEEYRYGDDGKLKQQYKECITQEPERMPPVHLKHQDLYE
jgi:hypothetical protein